MDLKDYRDKINGIDEQMIKLFEERMEVSAQIAKYKAENNLPIFDGARERSKLKAVNESLPEHLQDYGLSLYSLLMDLSKTYQHRTVGSGSEISEQIENAIRNTPALFPEKAVVACQGVEGAYSQTAAEKLFKYANIFFFNSFDAVFSAIENGLCRYGVLPVENSTAGTVNRVYDLMLQHHFHIVRSVRVKIDHNLLVKPGTKLQDIREVFSHEQAISQCSGFLGSLSGVKVTPVENTAVAAKFVAGSDRKDVAALSSRSCMELYGLTCLKPSVQDSSNNYTRFVC
ncbi:MAG: chorismate mutase, partial [Firmicutes bacterium]|nr:chorismate mutase [Bacillota bacterium]